MQKTAVPSKTHKVRVGRIVSNKMHKTVVVAIEWRQHHPVYKKAVRRVTKFYAHDERQECKLGDVVQIMETRPLSRLKRWRIIKIVARGDHVELPSAELEALAPEAPAQPSDPTSAPAVAEAPAPQAEASPVSA